MLPRTKRLTKAAFTTFFSHGKRLHTPHYTFIYNTHPTFHGAVVVSKKQAKKAVTRNKLRRQMYAILRGLERAYGCGGVWIVLVKQGLPIPHAEALEEAHSVFKKVYNH